jgi:F-type H+-transporting ATPase subunit a
MRLTAKKTAEFSSISHFQFLFNLPTLIFAPNFRNCMRLERLKCLPVAVFSLFFTLSGSIAFAQQEEHGQPTQEAEHAPVEKKGFNATEVIFGHVLNNHDFHFFDIVGDDGAKHPVSLPLPVILYSPEKGLTAFMSSKFEHGHAAHNGYAMLTDHSIKEWGLDPKKFNPQDIVAVNENGEYDASVKVYDLSLTRNVVQMLIAFALFTWVMLRIAKRYKSGVGVTSAPKGSQSLLEPVITFVRDEVAKPNLGAASYRYLPYLLTIFFFILINSLFGMIPGSANVTGNIAFTLVLGVTAFIVIMFSANKHFWAHIFNPPGVPGFVKVILIPVEILGIFIKPFALIIRLFANMVAGHIIIICLISLIFIFAQMSSVAGWAASPLSVAFTVFIYLIEVLVAFLQAFIFTNLAAVFIGQAIEGAHHDHEPESVHVGSGHDDPVLI